MQNFGAAQKAYNECYAFMTRKACEWIDFDLKNYQLTCQAALKEKDTAEQLQKREVEVREEYSRETVKFDGTKEQAIEAAKFKISEEMVIYRKMQSLMFTTNEQQRQANQAIEFSKMSDRIKEKFDFDLDQLSLAVK